MPTKHSSKSSQTPSRILVGVVMGSISDAPLIQETESVLRDLNIPYAIKVASAHRTPDLVRRFIASCEKRGALVFIAAAGGAAALPGVVAAETIRPVIGIPVTSHLSGFDSLLSIVQMPSGVPVATVAIGKAGARNAGYLAASILGVRDQKYAQILERVRAHQRNKIINDDRKRTPQS